jgi:flagellin-like hook-associated protein FlgL
MDVNNLGGPKTPIEPVTEVIQETKVSTSRNEPKNSSTEEPQDVSIEIQDIKQSEAAETRKKANRAITALNIAATATDEIQKLVESIGGIIDQAKTSDLAASRRDVLQKEANQLVDEIKTRALKTESDGVRPLLGDTVRFEVEERYGDALEIILPDTAKNAFGIGQVSLSMKDSIIDTITRVEQAKKQFEELRTAVDKASSSLKQSVDTFEVAIQNGEASQTSIRSLDQALALATSTHNGIGKSPKEAFGSISKLDLSAAALLRS